jgi:hypothetical protein
MVLLSLTLTTIWMTEDQNRKGQSGHLSGHMSGGEQALTTDASRSSLDKREGKKLSIISHARNLPVESAKPATIKNMSFAVFMYGAVSELHSSLIRLTQPIEQSELEAKLQHIMNVIHVIC